MNQEKKKLSVPCLPELDSMTLDQVAALLDEKGAKKTVDCLNWKDEYPYHPLNAISIAHYKT